MEVVSLGKSRGLFFGPRPAKDPMEEMAGEGHTREIDQDERWIDRNIQQPLALGLLINILIIWIILDYPLIVLIGTSIALITLLAIPLFARFLERNIPSGWSVVSEPDILCMTTGSWPLKAIFCQGIGGKRYIT
jgi:hypothetical protein